MNMTHAYSNVLFYDYVVNNKHTLLFQQVITNCRIGSHDEYDYNC